MTLPFRILHSDTGRADRLDVEINFSNMQLASEQTLLALLSPLDAWIAIAGSGGMGGDLIAPALSSVRLESRSAAAGTAVYRFSEVSLDPRCLQVLENVLHSIHLGGVKLDSVVVQSGLVPRFLSWAGEFPPVFAPTPFQYEYDATSRQVWIQIELEQDATTAELAGLEALVRMFGELCANRGYSEPGSLPGPGYLYVETVERFSDMLTVSMQRLQSSDFAFDALANLLHAAQGREPRVRSVQVM
jgi:hypothetical protein